VISFVDVKKSFGERQILRGVTFDVADGEVFFVIGQSGVGKSVLVKHVVGFVRPDSGEIRLDGQEVSRLSEEELMPVRRKCAMVFQHATLFDSMTCAENVALPLRKHHGLSADDALAEAELLLARVNMEAFGSRLPAELGDGMRKRVAIARALALEPRYMLFDEPTTGLDPVSARRVDRLIRDLASGLGVTCVVVSHDLRSIFDVADRIAMLYHGEVRMLGTPAEFRAAPDPVVEQFVNGRARGPID
jgi:phospholipid/cholesterol/gamma-HCH transport system ATP-binding protein